MPNNIAKSKNLIQKYLGKTVEANLDGKLFAHVPDTFRFTFEDPAELKERLLEEYSDYLEDWDLKEVVPVASVSSAKALDSQFAWLFLDFSDEEEPTVRVTTTDEWSEDNTVPSLDALNLQIR